MVLMFLQSLLYLVEKSYMVKNDIHHCFRHKVGDVIFCVQLIAISLFMMQHALFVGQYARVAVAIPLTFCY